MYIHNIHLYYLYIAHQALPVHGILQARILEWVAMPFLRDLPDSGIEPRSPALQADFFFFFIVWATKEALYWNLTASQSPLPTLSLQNSSLPKIISCLLFICFLRMPVFCLFARRYIPYVCFPDPFTQDHGWPRQGTGGGTQEPTFLEFSSAVSSAASSRWFQFYRKGDAPSSCGAALAPGR